MVSEFLQGTRSINPRNGALERKIIHRRRACPNLTALPTSPRAREFFLEDLDQQMNEHHWLLLKHSCSMNANGATKRRTSDSPPPRGNPDGSRLWCGSARPKRGWVHQPCNLKQTPCLTAGRSGPSQTRPPSLTGLTWSPRQHGIWDGHRGFARKY